MEFQCSGKDPIVVLSSCSSKSSLSSSQLGVVFHWNLLHWRTLSTRNLPRWKTLSTVSYSTGRLFPPFPRDIDSTISMLSNCLNSGKCFPLIADFRKVPNFLEWKALQAIGNWQVQWSGIAAIAGSWKPGVLECRKTGIPEYWNAGIQECRNTRMPEYRKAQSI